MKNLIRLTDYHIDEISEIFEIADEISEGKYKDFLRGKFIERTSEDRRYLYFPIITKKEYRQKKAEKFIYDAYNGSFLNFVSALSGGELISQEDAKEIEKLIEKETKR